MSQQREIKDPGIEAPIIVKLEGEQGIVGLTEKFEQLLEDSLNKLETFVESLYDEQDPRQ